MTKVVHGLIIAAIFIGCNSFKVEQSYASFEEFQEWLFQQKQIDSKAVYETIESYASNKNRQYSEQNDMFRSAFEIRDSSEFMIVLQNSDAGIRSIIYKLNGTELNRVEYYENGLAICLFPRDSIGQRDGKLCCYHDDGSIRFTGEFDHGKRVGVETNYAKRERWEVEE